MNVAVENEVDALEQERKALERRSLDEWRNAVEVQIRTDANESLQLKCNDTECPHPSLSSLAFMPDSEAAERVHDQVHDAETHALPDEWEQQIMTRSPAIPAATEFVTSEGHGKFVHWMQTADCRSLSLPRRRVPPAWPLSREHIDPSPPATSEPRVLFTIEEVESILTSEGRPDLITHLHHPLDIDSEFFDKLSDYYDISDTRDISRYFKNLSKCQSAYLAQILHIVHEHGDVFKQCLHRIDVNTWNQRYALGHDSPRKLGVAGISTNKQTRW